MDSIKEANSIFEQPWWLEAVAPGRWEVKEVRQGNRVVARLPLVATKRMGQKLYGMPICTQTMGPWLDCATTNRVKMLAKEKELINQLLEQIADKAQVDMYLDTRLQYTLPFRWKGYRCEPQYSYRFGDLTDTDALFRGMKDSRKSVIRKAEKELTVSDSDGIEVLLEMQEKTFARQGRKCPIPEEVIRSIDKACSEHNARMLLTARDNEGHIHAASYFVYDDKVCYYIMSGADPEYRNSGAGSLLIWEGIKRAARVSRAFDFEGSNIEDIETNFRSFGADYVIYYRVYRLHWLLTTADYLKPKIKQIIGYKN